ncbi:RNA polymerase sigma factor [Bacteroides sp. 51]|uniref:RNA polymerase sigma factor n=1 Tax=Bacteroides sp. 51 TaxID=2302938 RepID=UPI0013D71741|nr:sigma-70 family RNA polymerase sigma factor [Bacteroides sp. 51]NDV82982.1 sigma-70 family RNA polymerase sigma factor [Bacteroides sp. 51]
MSEVAVIFKQYQKQLRSFIGKRVLSKEDGEDILQDVFYQLSKVDLEENPIQKISSWLYAVARNLIIDRSRKQKEEEMPYRKKSEDDGSFIEELTVMILDEDASPEIDYVKALVWEELEIALAELPEEQRVVFELTELQGFSFKEISESTGVTVNTLISRKRYAVLHLRKRLSTLYNELLNE